MVWESLKSLLLYLFISYIKQKMSGTIVDAPADCTIYCKSVQHGDIITAALSKRSIADFDLCAFLNHTCTRCESVKDSLGRTALHVAVSCGRADVVKWLICNRHADIEVKDKESGYTALHRSIFYGKIHVAVELIKLGASISELDLDYLTVLEHAMKDGLKPESHFGELYAWGSNNNNLLGPQQSRESPELLDVFHKEYPSECVKQICIDQFHSVIITNSGRAYSCGHGQGGRLGLGIEQTIVCPRAISFAETLKSDVTCVQSSISRDHSIFLCSDGNIYTCGLNTNRVLGVHPPPEKLLVPKQLKHFCIDLKGVCAGRYHSVAWGCKAIYTWGLNGGQLGHKVNNKTQEQYIETPKKVKLINVDEVDIRAVAASDGATVVCTNRGDIYVLHEYLCRKIASRQLNIVQIDITGGKIDKLSLNQELAKKSHWELKVVALTNTGNLLLWQESDPHLSRCIFSINRAIITKQVTINISEILLVTDYGEAFKGYICQRKRKHINANISDKMFKGNEKSAFHKFLEKEDCMLIQLKKIPKIHRAISIQSDSKGKDFCIIQALPYKMFEFPSIIKSEMQNQIDILFKEVDESDNIHDVVFRVGKRHFPAHRYIISVKSPYFEKLFLENVEKVITIENINEVIFEQFLLYVYTGSCDLIKCGELTNQLLRNLCQKSDDETSRKEFSQDELKITSDISAYEYYKKVNPPQEQKSKVVNSGQNYKNPVRMLQELAKKYECKELHKLLSNLDMQKCFIRCKHTQNHEHKDHVVPLQVFNRAVFPAFYDVSIKCKDNREIRAHKCILAARLEYFNNMFSMRWGGNEITEITLPFAKSIAEALLEFIYTDSLSYLNTSDIDYIFKVLILADQLFVIRLKEQCELLLTNQLTLKNAVELLSFANLYNAVKLKHCCMQFITLNIIAFLELRSLDILDKELLKELSEFYFQNKPEIWCRVITPYSTAAADEEIISITNLYSFSLEDEVEQKAPVKSSQKRKVRTHKSSLSERNSISFENDTSLDSIIQFPDVPEEISRTKKDLVKVPDRIKSISLASKKIEEEDIQLQFTKLSSSKNYNSSDLSRSFNDENDFPELNSPPLYSSSNFHHKSLPQKIESNKHKIVRMSQKQRKRLSSESNNNLSPSISESPKNPWKIVSDASSPVSSVDTTFTDIISNERKQKENLVKITTKLLSYTQIEDRAIDELHKFYNSDDIDDEIITIERVAIGAIASPVWVPRVK